MPSRSLAFIAAVGLAVVDGSLGRAAPARPYRTTVVPHLEALLINGGGTPASNYQSHLLHVRRLVDVLRRSGVSDRRITILAGDGSDPEADLALRELQPEEDFWLVGGTHLERPFRTPTTLESSRVEGFTLRAATRTELGRWFSTTGRRLRKGDTLLLYVTDHGTKNAEDTRNNRITLWGKGESLSVSELRAQLANLDPEVRVVQLMSQCYSGSFANLAWKSPGELPRGNVCGYFSTNAERPAHGCYPEDRGADNVGHSFDFLQELEASGSFRNAQLHVLGQDVTPDVPLRTSDVFMEELLERKARAAGSNYTRFVDGLLAEAWKSKGAWEPEIRLLDSIGRNFGFFSPRRLDEIEEQTARVKEVSAQLSTHGRAWKTTLGDANRANLGRFLGKQRSWADRVSEPALRDLGPDGIRSLAEPFLLELADYTRGDAWTSTRIAILRGKTDSAAEAAYRMEVRLGVLLRMRTVLTSIAGRVYLARRGSSEERAAFEALLQCEGLDLPLGAGAATASVAQRPPFPSLDDDLRLAREVLPAWLGIRFKEAPEELRKANSLLPGAAAVVAVFPDSPASEAGLQGADVLLGPPGAPFADPGQVREWTMLATADHPAPLQVLRGEERFEVTLVPRPYPGKWPELPGPPRVSSAAPAWAPLQVRGYRGTLPDDRQGASPHLLFFWATWCGPCKAAVPELLAFEQERRTPVIAITDEPGETLDTFFQGFGRPFPEQVGTDELRRSFLAYGISGTPTFVLVDGDGVIRSYSTGYTRAKGLGVDGWKWSSDAVAASPP